MWFTNDSTAAVRAMNSEGLGKSGIEQDWQQHRLFTTMESYGWPLLSERWQSCAIAGNGDESA